MLKSTVKGHKLAYLAMIKSYDLNVFITLAIESKNKKVYTTL